MSKAMQVKAMVKNLASKNHVPAQSILQNYMLERLLERISISKYREIFILKGGMLIASLVGINNRTTIDMDVTLRGYPLSEDTIREAMSDICGVRMDDEVILEFDHIVPIRDDDEYGGYRVAIDITTGDIITPLAVRYTFHSNFENKLIDVWAYNIETILAEKVETILRRSVLNTRPRDFYDVYILMKTQQQVIDKEILIKALQATSGKRMSLPALQDKEKIIRTIQSDAIMRQRWERYCKENYYANGIEFDEVIGVLIDIVN
jgi:predicted nucleotidyltransferase component of viral defense system